MSKKMKAVFVTKYGLPEVLELRQVENPDRSRAIRRSQQWSHLMVSVIGNWAECG